MVPYEASQCRRANGIGAYFTHGPQAGRLAWSLYGTGAVISPSQSGPITGERFLEFVWQIAGRPQVHPENWKRERPLVIVLDNYSVHKCRLVQEAEALTKADIHLFYLPSYCPQMSRIERVWRTIKHDRMRQRSFSSISDLIAALDAALAEEAQSLLRLHGKSTACHDQAA